MIPVSVKKVILLSDRRQTDEILSGKPEERRELFDEAAGIVKFKRRKITTLKKLDEERQNLVRVTDILSELTKQLGPLERQSENSQNLSCKKRRTERTGYQPFPSGSPAYRRTSE